MEAIVIFVTTKDEEEARRIAEALVEQKFAACVNIIKGVRSIYTWNGAVQDEHEAQMVIKTRRELFPAVEAEVKRLHSYSTPEIIALPIAAASSAYLDWINKATIII